MSRLEKEAAEALLADVEVKLVTTPKLIVLVKEFLTVNNPRQIKRFNFKDAGFRHAAVNVIRHKLSNYDKVIGQIRPKCNGRYVQVLKNTVAKEIASKYPFLINECMEQRLGK